MSTITTRAGKGSPLTNAEVDDNFTNLNTDKAELSGAAFTGAITTNSTVDGRDVATDGSKLDGIEASADVTDTTNVTAAGALMDSELTSIASVKALNQGVATTDSPDFAALNVNGTATMDGLTVNSGATSTTLNFQNSGTAYSTLYNDINGVVVFSADAGNTGAASRMQLNVGGQRAFSIADGGDISFYEDTGTTAKFFWDASAESLGIGTSSPTSSSGYGTLSINGTTGGQLAFQTGGSAKQFIFSTVTDLSIYNQEAGNIKFVTNNAERMRIDSAGRVGIGCTPTSPLHIKSATNVNVRFDDSGSSSNTWYMNDAQNLYIPNVQLASTHTFYANGQRKVDIDSSGNVLVGKSASSFTTAGVELAQGGTAGKVQIMRASGGLTVVNTTDDGAAISIYKGTSAVGSIGASNGDLYLGNAATGLYFNDASASIHSYNTTTLSGGSTDGTVNLGASGVRFKDLYLSGEVIAGAGQNSNPSITSHVDTDTGLFFGGADILGFSTGGAERARIDSSGQVKVGTTGPTWDSTFSSFVNKGGFIASQSTSYNYIGGQAYYNGGFKRLNANAAELYEQSFGNHIFYSAISGTAGSAITWNERMRIDSSGNVLVGKTATDNTTAGTRIHPAGYASFTIANDYPIIANRLSSDGDIAVFRKDGATVGSIGTAGSDFYVTKSGSGQTGIYFNELGMLPMSGGSISDNTRNIGQTGYRFKDLYLSGGVHLGGTSDAHKLDDYEEVNFTATLRGSTGEPSTLLTVTGFATKIGRAVQYSIGFENVNTTGYAGSLSITGLPFANNGGRAMGNLVGYTGLTYSGTECFSVISVGNTILQAFTVSSNSVWASATHNAGASRYFWLTGTYMTTA